MSDLAGKIALSVHHGIAQILFSHPKANCLTKQLLAELARAFDHFTNDDQVRVIRLESAGDSAFCAGASFEDFKSVLTEEEGEDFFMGFARAILAMRRCPKLIVTRVQGKAVGGGLGLVAASDYAIASAAASARLSEFELGLGPFTIGPAVERKLGLGAFSAMSIDCEWRAAPWLAERGLYADVVPDAAELTIKMEKLTEKLAAMSADAAAELKRMFWRGTDDWQELLSERARTSGKLLAARKKQPGA